MANTDASVAPVEAWAAQRNRHPSGTFLLGVDPTDAKMTGNEEGPVVAAAAPGSASLETKRQYATGSSSEQNRGNGEVRPPYERPRSKKLHRTSSNQCFVDFDGWLQAFPRLRIEDLGPGFSTGSFKNSQGLELATYAWRQPGVPKAAIVLFHSYTSYVLFDFLQHQPPGDSSGDTQEEMETWVPKYPGSKNVKAVAGSWIEGFYSLGMNVYAMDHQSHGRSEGWKQWRCNVSKFEFLVTDALQFLNEKVITDPDLPPDVPIVLLGYSMGGNVVIQTLGRICSSETEAGLRPRVNHAVLLAPLMRIKLDFKTKLLLKVNRSLISCWLPNLRFSRDDNSGDCPYLGWWYEKDPFTYSGRTKSSMVAALYDASCKLQKVLSKFPPQLKVLCLQGTNDQTVDFHAPLKLYETPVRLDLLYLCGWSHYIPKSLKADKLLGLVITWIQKMLGDFFSVRSLRKKCPA